MGRMQDRVVLVTGGAGGIGAAACRAIAAEGGKVVVADLDADAAASVAREIAATGGVAEAVGVDVTDRSSVRGMIAHAVASFGELNVIFNNAGMNRPRCFMNVDEENFDEIVRVNAWGVIVCTQEAVRLGIPDVAVGVPCKDCPPLERLFTQFQEGGGELWLCPFCVNARDLGEETFVDNSKIAGATPMLEWLGETGTVIGY